MERYRRQSEKKIQKLREELMEKIREEQRQKIREEEEQRPVQEAQITKSVKGKAKRKDSIKIIAVYLQGAFKFILFLHSYF